MVIMHRSHLMQKEDDAFMETNRYRKYHLPFTIFQTSPFQEKYCPVNMYPRFQSTIIENKTNNTLVHFHTDGDGKRDYRYI